MKIEFHDWKTATNEREKYQLYLASREWAEKKEAVKKRSLCTCERCHNAPGEQVHHLTYAHKYAEPLDDLMHLCKPCHEFLSAKTNYDPKRVAPLRLKRKYGWQQIADVYLAGKITDSNWRDDLVDGYSYERGGVVADAYNSISCWQTVKEALCVPDGRRLNLTGPFWRPLDSDGGHGTIRNNRGEHCCGYLGHHGEFVMDTCLVPMIRTAINFSDLVFAWIDSLDCYGTLIELGFAHALEKCIAVASSERPKSKLGRNELWMVDSIADYSIKASSPKEAWRMLWKDA